MWQRTKVNICSLLLVILLPLLVSCNRPQERTTLRIGYTPIAANLPLYVAIEEGFFSERGLQVEPVEFSSPQLHTQALFQGRVQGTATMPTASAFLADKESPGSFRIVMFNVYVKGRHTDGFIVTPASEVSSLQDLKAKRIGLIPDPSAEIFVGFILRRLNGPGEVPEFLRLPLTEHLPALAAGRIDAAWTLDPVITIGLNSGSVKLLDEASLATHIRDPFLVAGYTLSTRIIEDDPRAADAYKQALARAAQFIRENPRQARSHILKYTKGLPADLVDRVAITEYGTADELRDDFVELERFFRREGLIKETANAASLLF